MDQSFPKLHKKGDWNHEVVRLWLQLMVCVVEGMEAEGGKVQTPQIHLSSNWVREDMAVRNQRQCESPHTHHYWPALRVW